MDYVYSSLFCQVPISHKRLVLLNKRMVLSILQEMALLEGPSSSVLYLRTCGVPTPPLIHKYADGEPYHWFNYKVVEVAKLPHRQVLDQDRQGLFPLVPLMDGGARREVIEEIITRYLPADDTITKERLALTRQFASLAFDKDDGAMQEWLKRRFMMLRDIFRDTYIHQCDVEEV